MGVFSEQLLSIKKNLIVAASLENYHLKEILNESDVWTSNDTSSIVALF